MMCFAILECLGPFHKDVNTRGSKDEVLPKYMYGGVKSFLAMRGNV